MIKVLRTGVFDSSLMIKDYKKTPPRITDCYEIELFIYGEGASNIDGVDYPHEKGNLLFLRPGHTRFSKNKFICFYLFLLLDDKTIEYLKNIPPVMKVSNFNEYKKCYSEIIRIHQSEKDELLLQSKIYELLNMILKEPENKTSAKETSLEKINKAIKYMEENIDKPIKLKDIAESVNYSPIYFHNVFCEKMGKTPHDVLLKKRLEKAKLYLLTTSYSMSEIVDKCGFSSLSYFDYKFKKVVGMTPSKFRKQKYTI